MDFDIDRVVLLSSPHSYRFAESAVSALLPKIAETEREHVGLGTIRLDYFNNEETDVQIDENVRRRHAYVFHSFTNQDGTYGPNNGYMGLYLIDDALRNASVDTITYLLPHFPYQRKDRTDRPRVPISARRTLQMLVPPNSTVPTRVITLDMHAKQIQGFASFTQDDLNATGLFVDYIYRNDLPTKNIVIVSPDAGGATRARHMAKKIELHTGTGTCGVALIDKRRPRDGEAEVMNVVGNVDGSVCYIRDDIADTAGTALAARTALVQRGAADVYLLATHGMFSLDKRNQGETTEERLRRSGMKVVVTDSIPRPDDYLDSNSDWLRMFSVAPLFGEAIYRVETGGSISELIE